MHLIITKYLSKGFISLFLTLLLTWLPGVATASIQNEDQTTVIEVVESPETASENSQVDKNHTPLALQEPEVFTSDYGESKIARRMTQAEKNQNAAENDGWGGAITIIAMCIVILALVVLSILFLIFGKVSEAILTSKKKKAKAAAEHPEPEDGHDLASGEVIAAISTALIQHFGDKHDVEDTILTIRRLQKSYSPWNSKIYNLRQNQDHKRNPSSEINFHESKRIQI